MKANITRIALLLPLLLCGCVHSKNSAQNQQPLAPPIEDTPPAKPDTAPTNLPPPVYTVPKPAQPAQQAEQTPPSPPPPRRQHHAPRPKPADQPSQNAQEAANTPPPEVSALGNFSTGDPADLRKQTSDSLAETERGLNGITRKLSDQEQKTSAQIREFLKQAHAALNTGDVDGAHTLAQKAKVLLTELTQ